MKRKKTEHEEVIEETSKPATYEHTITCLTCGYRHSEGGFVEKSNLDRDQLLAESKHNAGCRVMSLNGIISTHSSVEEASGAIITRYTIQQM